METILSLGLLTLGGCAEGHLTLTDLIQVHQEDCQTPAHDYGLGQLQLEGRAALDFLDKGR